jgi:RHS repeat-associated protein
MPVRRREGLSLFAFALLCAALLWPVVLSAELPQAVVNGVTDEPWRGEYQYDGAGNIKKIGANHYLYDGALRLVEATAITNVQGDVPRNYFYDAFGNLRQIQTNHDAAHPSIFAVDPQTNRIDGDPDCFPGSTCFFASYDPVIGHQLTGPDNAGYDYDAVDMMTALNTGARHELYIYDAGDQRIATITDANTTPIWRYTLRDAGSNVIRVWTSSGGSWSWNEDYVHRDGILLASISDSPAGEQRAHFHVDHLNSARLITDDEGRKVSVHTYWPFGLEAAGSDIGNERRKYTGHERDFAGTGNINDLDYMRARYYAPVVARFLSIDPAQSNPARPQTWNRYSYCFNQPINHFDPTGKGRTDFHHDVVQIIALAAGYSPAEAADVAYYSELPDHDFRKPESVAPGSVDYRRDFHFITSERLAELKGMAKGGNLYDVGTYAHAFADTIFHAGYGPVLGQLPGGAPQTFLDQLLFPKGAYQRSYDVDTTSMRLDDAVRAAHLLYSEFAKIRGEGPAIPWAAFSSALTEFLAADEHDVKRIYYYNKLCHVVGCDPKLNTQGFHELNPQ